MPKRLKKPVRPKRPKDVNQWAHQLVRESTEEPEAAQALDFAAQLKAYMSMLGQKGGKVSGKRRMQNLSDEQRQDIALKAARARWAKRRKKS